MPNTIHEVEPIAAEAATPFPPAGFAYDPVAAQCKSWKEYYSKKNTRRHHHGSTMIRGEQEQWIEGQFATRMEYERGWCYPGAYRLFPDYSWVCAETKAFASALYTRKRRGLERYHVLQRRRQEFRDRLANNFAVDTQRFHRWQDLCLPRDKYPTYKASVHAAGQSMGKLMGMAALLQEKGLLDQANEHAWELRFRFPGYSAPRNFLEEKFYHITTASLPSSSGVRRIVQLGTVCPALTVMINDLDVVDARPLQDRIRLCKSHFLHQSLDDPLQVAYAPSYAYFSKDRWIRTTLGRYLTRFFGEFLPEAAIREAANAWTEANKPLDLHLVPNTDPDGWEWVYEHGKGFNSCMVVNRTDKIYIDPHARGIHPVRAYACNHPDNHLALAYIGKPGVEAWARSIVNLKHKTYLRVYGDDRLKQVLVREGFQLDASKTLIGEVMQARRYRPDRSETKHQYILPYLDSGGYELIDAEAGLVQVAATGAPAAASAVATLYPSEIVYCYHCQTEHRFNRTRATGSVYLLDLYSTEEDKTYVCSECLEREQYRYGYHAPHLHASFMRDSDAVCIGETYYHKKHLAEWGIVEFGGKYYTKDQIVWLKGEERYILAIDAIRLSYEVYFPNRSAQLYAHRDDAVETSDGRWMHRRDAVTCVSSGRLGHPSTMFRIGDDQYVLPGEFRNNPWKFRATHVGGASDLKVSITYDPDCEFEQSLAQYIIDNAKRRDDIVYENITNGSRISPVRDYAWECLSYAKRERVRRVAVSVVTSVTPVIHASLAA